MHHLQEDATPLTIGSGSFGVVTKLTDKNKLSCTLAENFPKNAFSDAATKKAARQLFPEMVHADNTRLLSVENRSEVDEVTILEHVASGLEYLHDQKPPVCTSP